MYGAVMTATDSVAVLAILDPNRQVLHPLPYTLFLKLYDQEKAFSVVFGEGVLNDAITIVLFKTFVDMGHDNWDSEAVLGVAFNFLWLLVASTIVGMGSGVLCCVAIRRASIGEVGPLLKESRH